MTNIAVLGSGRVGTVLASGLAASGHTVTVGSRNAAEVVSAGSFSVTGVAEAVRAGAVVVNATPGDSSVERLGALAAEFEGRILVDVSNATRRGADGAPAGLLYPDSSVAEQLQKALPQTRVVKTLNTMLFSVMAAPDGLSGSPTAFLSGDDADAKAMVQGLLGDLGWTPEQVLDLGGIGSARGVEAVMLLVPEVIRARGFAPFAIGIVS